MAEALVALQQLIDKYPKSADLYAREYKVYLSVDDLKHASDALDLCLAHTTSPQLLAVRKRWKAALKIQLADEQQKEATRKAALNQSIQMALQMYSAGNITGATTALDDLKSKNPNDPEPFFASSQIYLQQQHLVRAEKDLEHAAKVNQNADMQAQYKTLLAQVVNQREQKVAALVDSTNQLIARLKFSEATKNLEQLDDLTSYDARAYLIRAALLASYRHYDDAVLIYQRVMQDPQLDASSRNHVQELMDLANSQKSFVSAPEGVRRCPFCGAVQLARAAYCPVCLSFLYPVENESWKNTTVEYKYDGDHLSHVTWHFHQSFNGSNTLGALFGGFAAAGGQSTNIEQKNDIDKTRDFSIEYANGVPQHVAFDSTADGGEVETYFASSVGNSVTKTGQTGGLNAKFNVEDYLVYPTSPIFDAQFAMKAFGQNVVRGFGANWTFNPFEWSEPHLYAFEYDAQGRAVKAFDVYTYAGQQTAAGHYAITGRRNLQGVNLGEEQTYTRFEYNSEGLLSAIVRVINGSETYRREISYGPAGIVSEKEISQGNSWSTWSYNWVDGKLASAYIEGRKIQDKSVTFVGAPKQPQGKRRKKA